ncbi:MAG: hypothetical protein H6680_04200 [Desulfobacteraceae bacterium]|nr:hypothetical protein [Desulfobacteraceae bacterium]
MFTKIGVKISFIIMVCLLAIAVPLGFMFGNIEGEKQKNILLDKAKHMSEVGATMVSQYLAEAVHSQILTRDQIFDTDYIKIPGFNPPKYQTAYSTYTDRVFLKPQDSFLKDPTIEYAVTLDKNGYLPTHNTKYQQALTFDEKRDLKTNRTKRIFTDKIVSEANSSDNVIVQEYKMDNGETIADVSSPVYVLGERWGIFSVGVNFKTLKDFKKQKIINFFFYTFILIGMTVVVVFIIVGVYVAPLKKMAKYMDALSTGKTDMELNVKETKDEHGELVASIKRMSDSYKVINRKFMELRRKIK